MAVPCFNTSKSNASTPTDYSYVEDPVAASILLSIYRTPYSGLFSTSESIMRHLVTTSSKISNDIELRHKLGCIGTSKFGFQFLNDSRDYEAMNQRIFFRCNVCSSELSSLKLESNGNSKRNPFNNLINHLSGAHHYTALIGLSKNKMTHMYFDESDIIDNNDDSDHDFTEDSKTEENVMSINQSTMATSLPSSLLTGSGNKLGNFWSLRNKFPNCFIRRDESDIDHNQFICNFCSKEFCEYNRFSYRNAGEHIKVCWVKIAQEKIEKCHPGEYNFCRR